MCECRPGTYTTCRCSGAVTVWLVAAVGILLQRGSIMHFRPNMYYDGNSLFCPSIGNALIEASTFMGKDEHAALQSQGLVASILHATCPAIHISQP